MRGRKPTPIKLRPILGQPIAGAPLSASSGGVGDAPEFLTPAQATVWREIVATAPHGLLQPCDRLLLENVCVQTVKVRKLAAMIERKGSVQRDRSHGGMERTAAWVKAHRAEAALLAKFCTALGLTPLSRSGIYLAPAPDERNEFSRLLDSYGPPARPLS